MMQLLYTFFIALSNNLDNISVRIAYSIRGIKISIQKNLWISAITFIISSFAAYSGKMLSGIFSKSISSCISMIILIVIGLVIMVESLKKPEDKPDQLPVSQKGKGIFNILKKPENADMDDSKDIDYKEATLLGVALSIDCIGGGLSAGMLGLNFLLFGFMSALISFSALWAGNYITELFKKWNLGNKASVISGIALIMIGIKQVL